MVAATNFYFALSDYAVITRDLRIDLFRGLSLHIALLAVVIVETPLVDARKLIGPSDLFRRPY
jgi:hypothetical protein